jgi:ribosome assembly protein YihI (activator of Der GTPase)
MTLPLHIRLTLCLPRKAAGRISYKIIDDVIPKTELCELENKYAAGQLLYRLRKKRKLKKENLQPVYDQTLDLALSMGVYQSLATLHLTP